jgi:peptidoglycan/xylan/chitin deacetylase (PgdA/CDA1 family)/glycerol-3-phosphate acyltransferase PlsY
MALDSFSFLILFNYLIGSIDLEVFVDKTFYKGTKHETIRGEGPFSPLWLVLLLNFAKGIVAVLLAKLLIGSSMAMVLGGISVSCGHSMPLFKGSSRRKILFPALGSIFFISPLVFFFIVSVTIFTILLTGYILTGTIVMCLAMPLSFWYFKRYDLYIIYGVVNATMLLYQLIPEIEEWSGGERHKTSRRTFIRDVYQLQVNDSVCAKQGVVFRVILLLSVVGLGGLLFLNRYVYKGFGIHVEIMRRGSPLLPYVAITFDDGPDPIYTPLILDILKEHDVKATFFLVGKHVEANPEIARRIVEEGHEIGNHTYSHKNLFGLARDKILDEIVLCEKAIIEATGERPHLFRPPRGLYNQDVMDILSERKYMMSLWSDSSRDWMEVSPRSVRRYVLNDISNGAILLFHDSGSIIASEGGSRYNTVKALPIIIAEMRQRGYVPVTITELSIAAGLTGSEDVR